MSSKSESWKPPEKWCRTPYNGCRRKLVLAFDIGTTLSGISYSILDPHQVPEVRPVTRFPAQEHISGAFKIPTIIYYDHAGKVRAVGAEATRDGIYETAYNGEWFKVEWFKPRLSPKSEDFPPLPLNKTVVDVYADFLQYLLLCSSRYIQETHAGGPQLWESMKDDIDFVLSHPNGWEDAAQSKLRAAAVMAKLIPDTPAGHACLSLVTEGETGLYSAIRSGLLGAAKSEDGVVVVDAGKRTIDISSYSKRMSDNTETYEENAPPQCHLHGGDFVTIHCRLFLENFLQDSPYFDDLDHIIRCFDRTTKFRFRNSDEPQYIKFGSTRDNDASRNIRFGQMKLLGSDVALFFQPSLDCIVKAVQDQLKVTDKPIAHVVLIGGFSKNNWLFDAVQAALTPSGVNVVRPDYMSHISDGAISFYLDHYVRTRVSKFAYGSFCHIPFDPSSADHRARRSHVFTSMLGQKRIAEAFNVILPKGTHVSEAKEFRRPYFKVSKSKEDLKSSLFPIWAYQGEETNPRWKDVDTQNYTKLRTIEVDLSLVPLMPQASASRGEPYFRLDYELVLLFGLTELKAHIVWKEGGVEKRSAAKIIYDPDNLKSIKQDDRSRPLSFISIW